MKDYFGRELKVGDFCFYTTGTRGHNFSYCKVAGFTAKKVIALFKGGESIVDSGSLAKITMDELGDITKREAVVVDIDGTFLREEGLHGKEVVNYDILIEIKKHMQQGRTVIFLTDRDDSSYYKETKQSIDFYLSDDERKNYSLITNYFTKTRNEKQHKEIKIKDIMKRYNIINWYEDNPAIQKIANKYNIPFTLVTQ